MMRMTTMPAKIPLMTLSYTTTMKTIKVTRTVGSTDRRKKRMGTMRTP